MSRIHEKIRPDIAVRAHHVRRIKYTHAAFMKRFHQDLQITTLSDIMPIILIILPHSAYSSTFPY